MGAGGRAGPHPWLLAERPARLAHLSRGTYLFPVRIRSQSPIRFAWAFAILWHLIAAPATFLGAVPAIQQGKTVAWVALFFPVAGGILLIWAAHLTLRFWRFGVSWLELEGSGATLGGALRARITAQRLPEDSTVDLTLTCINKVVTGSGQNRSTWEKVVWQEQQRVPREALEPGPEGESVPVSFRLPFDAPPTRADNPNDRIVWRLEARARLAGVDYDEMFEVPVAPSLPGKEPAGAGVAVATPDPARPEASRIVVEEAEGGTRFVLPGGRNARATFVVGLFAAIFMGGGGLFYYLASAGLRGDWFGVGVTSVIAVVLIPFILVLVLITLHTAFLRTSLVAGSSGLAVTSHLLGLSWTVSAPAKEIGDIKLSVGMQVGLTPYYDLKIARAGGGRPMTISAMLKDKREAEWLASAIKKSLR